MAIVLWEVKVWHIKLYRQVARACTKLHGINDDIPLAVTIGNGILSTLERLLFTSARDIGSPRISIHTETLAVY